MTVNKKGYGFVIFVVLYEILVCLMYALLFGYSPELEVDYNIGDLFLISGLTILAIVGTSFFIKDSALSILILPMQDLAGSH